MGFEALGGKAARDREQYGDRLPPGQHVAKGWPVLSYGKVPAIDTGSWRLRGGGLVERELDLDWESFQALPQVERANDVHCVTRWSLLDNTWGGVDVSTILDTAGVLPGATHALVHGHGGYTANLPLDALRADGVMLVHNRNGEPLSAEHGGPVRLVVPQLYFWKSVKWVERITLLDHDRPGFWERFAYHNDGDPWREQRYAKGPVRR